jgi:hypothetical protein
MALEDEILRWNGFRNALVAKEDREAFEELMDMCREQRYGKRQRDEPDSL